MTSTTGKSAFAKGFRDGLPFLLVAGPFAMLFGVVATEAGLPLLQTMVMTSLVIAGASQFAALQLMLDGAGLWLVLAGALAVNLRMAMYSASLVPWLGKAPLWQRACAAYLLFDQPYALSVSEFEARPELSVPERVAYFFGTVVHLVPVWIGGTLLGALVGETIPESLALDFAMPITFLTLVAPMLKTLAHVAAAVVSIAVALLLAGMPAGTGLLVAAGAAMVTGALVEIWMGRAAP